jgi:hypothetical protein
LIELHILLDHFNIQIVLGGTFMKKYIAILLLALSVLACGLGPSSQLITTQTALASTAAAVSDLSTKAAWTEMPASVPTPDYVAKLTGSDLYSGPDESYPKTAFIYGDVTIIGQAYECAWFEVVSNSNSSYTGWVRANKLSRSIKCSDVIAADIPPVPPTPTITPIPTPSATDTPLPTPTATEVPANVVPPPPAVSCQINSNIIIQNRSGAPFTLNLTGPGNFTFYLGADDYSTVKVCSGTYNYTVYGTCNGSPASGSGRISDGDQVYFACS